MYKGQVLGNCGEDVVHSGRGNCEVIPGKTTYLLLSSLKARYPMDQDEFNTNLPGYITTTGPLRLIPIGPISGNDPTGGDLLTSDPGNYGGTSTVGVNPTSVSYQVRDGSPCLYKELSKLNKRDVRIFQVDDSNLISGTVITSDNVDQFAGYEGRVYVREVEATGTTPYQLFINIDYSSNYENEKKNRHSFYIDAVPEGLQGVVLQAGGVASTVRVVTACGAEDITSDFGTDWTPVMFVQANGTAATTATFNEDTGLITLAPAGSYRVADADVLATGDIVGYEGVKTYLTLP